MRNILKIATRLDLSGLYNLSDKLYKIAQTYVPPVEFYQGVDRSKYKGNYDQKMLALRNRNNQNYTNPYSNSYSNAPIMDINQYANNPYTPKEIMDIRKQLVPTDFQGEIYQTKKGDTLIKTSDPKSFSIGLMEYARINKFPNLQLAFDDYANNGATYRGQLISQVPELKELYLRISKNPGSISKQMIEQEIRNIVAESVGMSGYQKDSNQPTYNRQYNPQTGSSEGYLVQEYRQNIYQGDPNSLPFIKSEITNDKYISQKNKQQLLSELESKVNTLK
jgi:hypothetical protein